MKTALIDAFRRWRDYSGRSTRSEFWWFYLFSQIPILVTSGPDNISPLALVTSVIIGLLLVPIILPLTIRRMHDVGKSGWFIFVPLYNLYLLVQPAVEKGRIPNWVLAEGVSFVFVVILISRLFVNGFKDTDAIISLFFWTFFFVATRLKNQRAKNTQGENGLVE